MRKFFLATMALGFFQVSLMAGDAARPYSLILYNVTDEVKFEAYYQASGPVLDAAGGYVERELKLMGDVTASFEGVGPYNRALVVYFDSAEGPQKISEHPDYQKVHDLLAASVDNMAYFSGSAPMSKVADVDPSRLYLIKLSYFKENTEGRDQMLKDVEGKLASYKIRPERVFNPTYAMGLDQPSEVGLFYYEDMKDQARLYGDETAMAAIGEFNKTYLNNYAYLAGMAVNHTPPRVALKDSKVDPMARQHTPAPLQITKNIHLKASPKKVWKLVGNHKKLPELLPMIHKVTIDNSQAKVKGGEGCVRICDMGEGGTLTENIVAYNPPMGYAYAITADNPFQMKDHLGVFHLEPAAGGGTRLTWNQYFDHPMPEMVVQNISPIMDMVIQKMTERFGGEAIN